MHWRYLLILLLSLSFATAESYTLYTPGNITLAEKNLSLELNLRSSGNLNEKTVAYENAAKTNQSLTGFREQLLISLAEAKDDDIIVIKTPQGSFLVNYGLCTENNGYDFCFTSTIYPVEDLTLSDNKLDSVKYAYGIPNIPFTITITQKAVTITPPSSVSVQRTITPTTLFPGENATINITASNTGSPSERILVMDRPPLPITKGNTVFTIASLNQGESASITYIVTPQETGTYIFPKIESYSVPEQTLTVNPHIGIDVKTTTGFVDEENFFNATITNYYPGPINITSVVVAADAAFTQATTPGTTIFARSRLIAENFNVTTTQTISGTTVSQTPGNHFLSFTITYKATGTHTIQTTANYTILERIVKPTITIENKTATVLITNTQADYIIDVRVQFDNETKKIVIIPSLGNATINYTYATPGNKTITINYLRNGKPENKTITTFITSARAEQVLEDVTQEQPPQTTPEQIIILPPNEPKKGFFTSIIDFFASIFGL